MIDNYLWWAGLGITPQFFKIMNGLTPQYLIDPIPVPRRHLFGRHPANDLYETKDFLTPVICWNKLRLGKLIHWKNSKKKLLKDIKPEPKSIYNLHDPNGTKFI